MDKPKVGPKDFFLWVAAMAALYGGVFSFISILFDYINAVFPNPVSDNYYYGDPYFTNVSYETASLIVLTPVFLALMRVIRRDIARDPSRNETWVRRWALFLVLFVAGATMVVDLIVLLTTFLQGEDMTVGFLLKVLVVFLVAGAGFLHFLSDMRGYWERNPGKAKLVNLAVGILVLVTIVSGFFIIGTPQELRKLKSDAQRVTDLQNIQWQIVDYWQTKETLPTELALLEDSIKGYVVAEDPKTGEAYRYEKTGTLTFKLCAVFEAESAGSETNVTRPIQVGIMEENWQHGTGEVCFDRTIDPEFYPPFPKMR